MCALNGKVGAMLYHGELNNKDGRVNQSFKAEDMRRGLSADKLQMCRLHNGSEPGSSPAQPGNRHASLVIERLGQVFDYRFC